MTYIGLSYVGRVYTKKMDKRESGSPVGGSVLKFKVSSFFLKFRLGLARALLFDTSLKQQVLPAFYGYYFLGFIDFRFFPKLFSSTTQVPNFVILESTRSVLLILIPFIVSTYAFFCDINSHIFFLSMFRNMFLPGNHGIVNLCIWLKFQLDISKRF